MTPIQVFRDTFRIAELLIDVYTLLQNDGLQREGRLVDSLRALLACKEDEPILLIANEVFLGCIREAAEVDEQKLRRQSLESLLRQAVVSGCTAYETYLSTLLAEHVLTVIELRQHEFFPTDDEVVKYFKDMALGIHEAFRLLNQADRALFLRNKIVTYVQKKNLSSVNGLHTVGLLLGVPDPWDTLAAHLNRDRKELKRTIADAIERRNAIVHRADRDLSSKDLEKQSINLAWAQQAVDTIKHVCVGLDEIVAQWMRQFQVELDARKQENAHA